MMGSICKKARVPGSYQASGNDGAFWNRLLFMMAVPGATCFLMPSCKITPANSPKVA